jgi:ABC-type transport system involved in Fe-S cluster assembly fused permease/ATPase subunit
VVFNILPTILELIAVIVILWSQFDAPFAWVTIVMIVIYSVFTLLVTKWRTQFRVEMNLAESTAHTRSLDSLLNYETVKIFGNEQRELKRYHQSLSNWVQSSIKSYHSLAYLNVGQGVIIATGLTILLIMAGEGVAAGEISLGDFVMVNAFLIQMYIPLNFLGSIYRDMNHALVDMDKMFDVLDITPEVSEQPDAHPLTVDKASVEFNDVCFGFEPDRLVLKDISFVIPGGKTVAVVGPSGAGKSTLSRLLLRFYDPLSGTVSIDDQDIREVTLASLRQTMAMVPQDTVLFNDTIKYNIGYGFPDASQEEIEQVAKLAQLDDFINQHPQRYDILVGERGLKLSGGEKQRVAIARAALKKAKLLIFDEATSSLDSRSEKAIQQALAKVSQNTTTLVIAHRLSTIVNADQILVLDGGRIVERGTHNDLLSTRGLYHQMWELQKEQRLYTEQDSLATP